MRQVNATTDDDNNNKDNGKAKLYKISKLSSVSTKKESIEIPLVIGIIIVTWVTRCELNGNFRDASLRYIGSSLRTHQKRETLSTNNTLFSQWLRRDDDGRHNRPARGWCCNSGLSRERRKVSNSIV